MGYKQTFSVAMSDIQCGSIIPQLYGNYKRAPSGNLSLSSSKRRVIVICMAMCALSAKWTKTPKPNSACHMVSPP